MTDQEILVELLLRWEEAQEKGQPLSAEVICNDHPHLLSSFNQQVTLLKKVSWIHQGNDLPPPEDHSGMKGGYIDQEKMKTYPQWGRYLVKSYLGHGNYGFVWKAWDPELNRTVAIKIPQQRSQQASLHFSEEARRIALLSHPGVVRIFDVGVDHETMFLVCEFIEGKTLDQLPLELNNPQHIQVVIEKMAQIGEALHYAHNRGVIHGDLKESNILIDDQGMPKITDFGISNLGEMSEGDASLGHVIRGTSVYMAPELLQGRVSQHNMSTDIYAMGVMLYRLLTKQWPRDSHTLFQLIDDRKPIIPLRKHNPAVPVWLEHVCLMALAENPENRYRSARDLAADLRRRYLTTPRRFPWLAAAGVLVTALIITLLIFNSDRVKASLTNHLQAGQKVQTTIRVIANSPPHKVFEYQKLIGHRDLVSSLHFLNNTTLLSASYDRKIYIWDITTGKVIREVPGLINQGTFSLEFNNQKTKVYIGFIDNDKKSVIHEYAYPSFARLRTLFLDLHEDRLRLALSPDDRFLAATGNTGFCAWDLATGTRTLQIENAGEPRGIAVTAEKQLLVGFKMDVLKIYDAASGQQIDTVGDTLSIRSLKSTGKPNEFVSVGNYGYWMIYDLGKKPAELTKIQPRDVGERQFSVVSRCVDQILIGYQTGVIRLWNIRSKKVMCSFHGPSTTVHSLAVSPDTTQFASSDELGNICLWAIPAFESGALE